MKEVILVSGMFKMLSTWLRIKCAFKDVKAAIPLLLFLIYFIWHLRKNHNSYLKAKLFYNTKFGNSASKYDIPPIAKNIEKEDVNINIDNFKFYILNLF